MSRLLSATNATPEAEILDADIDEDAEDELVRQAVAIFDSTVGPTHDRQQHHAKARAQVLELFSRADVSPELPSIIAGIADLYDAGYDIAADHMEMAHWGLPHPLR